jgi:hypothetical protein
MQRSKVKRKFVILVFKIRVGSVAMSQRGAISLPIVIAVVLGLGFGASAYLNMSQYQRAQQDKKLLKGEITDLRYQIKQDQLASGDPSPSPSPEASPSPSPSPSATPVPTTTPEVAGASAHTMTVKTAATLRSRATVSSAAVLSAKIPINKVVTVTGALTNGYYPVTVDGSAGFIVASALR